MISLLNSGFEKILFLFYENKLSSFHLRELSRRTNIHIPSLSKYLDRLVALDILKFKFDANLKKYYLNFKKKIFILFELFDLKRFELLPKIRQDAINLFIDSLIEKPLFVVLFGSTAKNTFKNNSDIDLLLIANSKLNLKKAIKNVESLTGIKISPFQISFSDFLRELRLKEDKLVQSALTSGYPIFNGVYFYEVLNERELFKKIN